MNPSYEHCTQRAKRNYNLQEKTAKEASKWKKNCGTKYTVSTKKKSK
jgi:hypothetical protein